MKIRTTGAIILLMVLIGSSATLAVATPIITIGDIDYYNTQDNFCINEGIPGNANLSFIYSEANEMGLKHEKIWYNSSANSTTYKFTTQKIYVEWWFTPDIKEFVYIDENTNDLYRINVNYSLIDIPENPYEERHQQLIENYTLLLNNYNLTNETLANITLQFNELNNTHNQKMQLLNTTLVEQGSLSENLTGLRAAFIELDDDYNNTYALWKSAISNVTTLQTDYEGLSGDYNQLEKDHNDLSGALPLYFCITVIGVFLITFIYARRKELFNRTPEATDEITTGYGKIHSSIDKHILSRFRNDMQTGEKPSAGRIEEVMSEEGKEDLPIFPGTKNETDEKIDALTSTQKVFQKSIVEDVLKLNKRLNKVEADVKELIRQPVKK